MESSQVQWMPAIIILVAGTIVGILLVWRTSRGRSEEEPITDDNELELRDLVAKREVLIRELRELDDTAAKLAPEQLARERYRLELDLAATLRELDGEADIVEEQHVAASAAAARDEAAAGPPRSPLSGFLWGAGSMAVVAALFFWVNTVANDRGQGGSMTGNAQMSSQQMPADHPEIAQLQARIQQNPNDLQARLDLAQADLMANDLMGVFEQTRYVLGQEPENPRALTLQALPRLAMGQGELATEMLNKALSIQPDLIDAWIHLAIVQANTGKVEEAKQTAAEAAKRFPEQATMFQSMGPELDRMAAEVAQNAQNDGKPNPHANIPESGEGVPAGMAPASPPAATPPMMAGATTPGAAGGPSVSGVMQLDSSVKGLNYPATVFLMARPQGVTAGPPVAVKRIEVSSFPLSFTLGPADSMMGQPLPDKVRLEARVDFDGNAMTQEPNDPIAIIDGLASGTNNVKLVLKPE